MKRRTLIVGAAGIAAGGLALGSGAFSSVEAERRVEVETAGDADAYLQIEFGYDVSDISGEFTESSGDGLIAIDVNSITTSDLGDGDGPNIDAFTALDELFTATNAGSEGDEVYLWAEFPDDDDSNFLEEIYFYPERDDDTRLEEGESAVELGTGDSVDIGIAIEKGPGESVNPYDPDEDLTLYADTELPDDTNSYGL